MSSKSTKCLVTCPKVRQDLRAAIAEAPWLADEIFPRKKKDVDSYPPKDTEDVRKYVTPVDSPHIPVRRDDERIDLIEERELIAEKPVIELIEEVSDAVDEIEIVENEIDRRTELAESEFELPQKPDVDSELERHVEYEKEEEALTDYERFIEEELQESLIAGKIPPVDEPKVVHREILKEIDREEPAEPLKEQEITAVAEEPQARIELLAKRESPPSLIKPLEAAPRELPAPVPTTSKDVSGEILPNGEKERITRKLKERQRLVNHYYTRSFDYFEDVCKCSLTCILYNLSRDQFARSIFASLALFTVGLKLCSELDAWEMPRRVI